MRAKIGCSAAPRHAPRRRARTATASALHIFVSSIDLLGRRHHPPPANLRAAMCAPRRAARARRPRRRRRRRSTAPRRGAAREERALGAPTCAASRARGINASSPTNAESYARIAALLQLLLDTHRTRDATCRMAGWRACSCHGFLAATVCRLDHCSLGPRDSPPPPPSTIINNS